MRSGKYLIIYLGSIRSIINHAGSFSLIAFTDRATDIAALSPMSSDHQFKINGFKIRNIIRATFNTITIEEITTSTQFLLEFFLVIVMYHNKDIVKPNVPNHSHNQEKRPANARHFSWLGIVNVFHEESYSMPFVKQYSIASS